MGESFSARGGPWVIGQLLLMAAVCYAAPAYSKLPQLPALEFATRWLGAALLVGGALITLIGSVNLGKNLTPYPKPKPDGALVQSGVYSIVRDPLYTGLIALAFGWSILWQSGPALFLSICFFALLDAKCRHEERWLRAKFPEYAAYAKRVRRLIPRVY